MITPPHQITLELPDWLRERQTAVAAEHFATPERQMTLAIELARENVQRQAGGPFGAAIFSHDGRLVSTGVNLVLAGGSSIWHAEVVAIAAAQQATGQHRLIPNEDTGYTLATSCEPCAMCLGAIGWSGVRHVICGARDADVRAIGFEEGMKPREGIHALAKHAISVTADILRDEAIAVLEQYRVSGGTIY